MENISFQYPLWLIAFCLLLAFFFSAILYYRDQRFASKSALQSRLLALVRFTSVAIVSILLLGPFVKKTVQETRQPIIAILGDNSQSVGNWLGEENKSFFSNEMLQLQKALSEKFAVDSYTFGAYVQPTTWDSLSYNDKLTNINDVLSYVSDIYEGANLGAVVLATDGIFNDGRNPAYSSFNFNAPIYALTLGDTTRKKDLLIKNVFYNEIGYLNDKLAIEVDIQAYNTVSESANLIVEKEVNGNFIQRSSQRINLNSNDFFTSVSIEEALDKPGIIHYRLRLSRLNNESNYANNIRDIFIEVLDARQNILLVANAPHPDITAIKQLLEQNKNYEVTTTYELPPEALLNRSDMVILHNLPSQSKDISSLINSLNQRKTPRMYIVGSQTYLPAFNQIQNDLTINAQGNTTNDAQAIPKESFNYFNLDPGVLNNVNQYPPLQSIFGDYQLSGKVHTLMNQKIGSVNTDYPLWSFVDNDGIKTAYLFGEGIWRWKLFDYLQRGNFNNISSLLDNSIVYTSTKEDKRKFRASSSQNIFTENEEVSFVAELYNNSYQLVNEPDVFLQVLNRQSEVFDFTFSKRGNSYILNAGKLAPGQYLFKASTTYNGEVFESEGKFTVSAISYELANMEADYNILYDLSQRKGGGVYTLSDIGLLQQELLSNDQLKPLLHQNLTTQPLIDSKWIFVLLVLLLGGEWFIRRYLGSI